MANPTWNEIATTTIDQRSRRIADNVSNNNALLAELQMKKRIKPFSGGISIVEELSYQENATYKRYSGYEQLNVQPSDVFTAAEYSIKQSHMAITVNGLERLQNAGREQLIDLVASRIENAAQSMENNLSRDVYSDGTADGGKQMNGLAALIPTAPNTCTVGGINRATHEYWRNKAKTAAVLSDVKTELEAMYVQLIRGTDMPHMAVVDNDVYVALLSQLQEQQRFQDDATAKMGFKNLVFLGIPVILDGGHGGNAPSKRCYFINSKYLKYRPHSERNIMSTDLVKSYDQDAWVSSMFWAGNICMSNASLQGVVQFA